MHARTVVTALAIFFIPAGGLAQTPTNPPPDQPSAAVENDANPTRAVLFSMRPEIYRPSDRITQAALILRYDQASLRERRWLPGKRGVVLRLEMPVSYTHAGDALQQGGLGDAYAQLLLLPYFTRTFAFFAGTGLKVPTATVGDSKLPLVIALAACTADAVTIRQVAMMVRAKVRLMLDIGSSMHGRRQRLNRAVRRLSCIEHRVSSIQDRASRSRR